jgi:hypothetical protein
LLHLQRERAGASFGPRIGRGDSGFGLRFRQCCGPLVSGYEKTSESPSGKLKSLLVDHGNRTVLRMKNSIYALGGYFASPGTRDDDREKRRHLSSASVIGNVK